MRRNSPVHFEQTEDGDVLIDSSGERLHVAGAGSSSGGSQGGGGTPSSGGSAPIPVCVSANDVVLDGMLGSWAEAYTPLPDVWSLAEGERPDTAIVASEPLLFVGSIAAYGTAASDKVEYGAFLSGLWPNIGAVVADQLAEGDSVEVQTPCIFRLDTGDNAQLRLSGMNVQNCTLIGAVYLLGSGSITPDVVDV